ncbi:alanine--tRNA ligase [Actinomadura sp. SCN-SB]|uniref:alanine--tRNA ligase n=1 Tax=Actinomadura sp. SCN-SB TaxID=3373092 RepID=UPI0037500676
MLSGEIRQTFLDFFTERDHRVVPSSPLVPSDPTLLLTGAGMDQFKPYFLGRSEPDHPRAVSVQRCARTTDLDHVGRTTRHTTFFEMLGNFSFGDYFKEEATAWAWELLTRGFGLDPSRLWVTVYLDDDEAVRLWRRIGVPGERIQRLGMADNFWSMGVPGPCGPSSELHYDRGPAFGREGGPAVDGERHLEIWNLVFMQNVRGEGPSKEGYPIVGDLPAPSIDTGLGLDRLAAILQDVDTLMETDLLAPTLRLVQDLSGREYPGRDGGEESTSFRIVVDHARTIAFLIADGVLPSPEGRGYVLRRLMRRAVRHARLLGVDEPALPALTSRVVDTLGPAWPRLVDGRELITQVCEAEEETFARTLRQGSRMLDSAIGRARTSGSTVLPGRAAFDLHNSYGFPFDLTVDAARAAGLTVDEDAFTALLEEQRRQAYEASRERKGGEAARRDLYRRVADEHGLTTFVGYDATSAESRVLALLDGSGRSVASASEGDELEVILDRSPFYAEGGGQVGDTGTLRTSGGTVLEIRDTRPGLDGLHVHSARVVSGEIRTGDEAEAIVDAARRAATARSHSATHVLHAMLRRFLGEHAVQRGSRVEPGRLRFDFSHFAHVDVRHVQSLVNDYLMDDPEVRVWEAKRDEVMSPGFGLMADAVALFGERYGERVRIVDIGDASRELCGGTHVGHGSQAGPLHILSETSIGTGLRRIEALTGPDALRHHDHEHALLHELAALLKVPADQAPERLRQRLDTFAEAQRHLEALRASERAALADRLTGGAEILPGGIWLVTATVPDGVVSDAGDLRTLALETIARCPSGEGAVVLGARTGTAASLAAALTPRLAGSGLRAAELLTTAARTVGGGAGGKGGVATAGGRDTGRLDEAVAQAARTARELLTSAP